MVFVLTVLSVSAQQWMQIHRTDRGTTWSIPLRIDSTHFDIGDGMFRSYPVNKDGWQMTVPFAMADVDSIDFATSLADDEKGHDKYRCFAMYITTDGEMPITEKEVWQTCHIAIDGRGEYSNFSGTGRIRGRGNSTWEWYDKKPYKFKLDQKSKLLGMEKAKDWNLLANYRDVTDMMNALAFETARLMGMPNTNHTRFVEVFLNGEYIGLYQLTEKIEVDDNRVDIDRDEGVLFSLDADDGPTHSPSATDNCWSEVFRLPLCMKYPDEPTYDQLQALRTDFARLEHAIQDCDYAMADSLMDMSSFIGMLQLHEYLYNVEIDAPRSMYVYRDKDGKFTFGPVWDWDAGFDFDWATMTTGHRFFSDYRELIYGTDPVKGTGAAYGISKFFLSLFNSQEFVTCYKEQWATVSAQLLEQPWQAVQSWVAGLKQGAYERDITRWPLKGMDINTELNKMEAWLQKRLAYLNTVIANYPDGKSDPKPGALEIVSTINKSVTLSYRSGYSQGGTITVDQNVVKKALGHASSSNVSLVPLNANNEVGQNTAAGTYGAWFDADGNTCNWSEGHVYVEANTLYSWNYGCHPDNCQQGHTHPIKMQYRYTSEDGTIKAVNVNVSFVVGK